MAICTVDVFLQHIATSILSVIDIVENESNHVWCICSADYAKMWISLCGMKNWNNFLLNFSCKTSVENSKFDLFSLILGI